MKKILEVCAFNIQSCIAAENAGAYRVELCDNPVEGGTTPSYGTLKQARERIALKIYPIIRPRSGNYYYSDDEYAIIKHDIAIARELGCDGISVGAQNIDATINIEMMKRIVEWAGPLGVTCNRAFDGTPDPHAALDALIEAGCERVLTSGLETAAPDGSPLLAKLVQQAAGRIIIMPGAGVKSINIRKLAEETGCTEFHSSGRAIAPNPQTYITTKVNDYGNVYISDENELKAMIREIS
ncbi:MAG: copper homeostasis protein CutC [Chitinophagaceae bacterium]|nr:MAG: copper homeostasis protein CutC [Chitinophagaceae bacterium]